MYGQFMTHGQKNIGYRIKSHFPFASIIRSSPKSPH